MPKPKPPKAPPTPVPQEPGVTYEETPEHAERKHLRKLAALEAQAAAEGENGQDVSDL